MYLYLKSLSLNALTETSVCLETFVSETSLTEKGYIIVIPVKMIGSRDNVINIPKEDATQRERLHLRLIFLYY